MKSIQFSVHIKLQVCGGSAKVCVPRHTSYRTYHLDTGPITKEIIKECQCQGTPEGCKRRKRFITYFEGTSFEQAIDVGKCLGVCRGYGISKPLANSYYSSVLVAANYSLQRNSV